MATSGSTDFTLTRDDIITEAMETIDSVSTGATIPTADITSIARTFNIFVKALQLEGANLWTRTWTQKALSTSSVVSSGGSNYKCGKAHTSGATDEPGVGANWTTYWEITTDTAAGAWATSTSYTFIGEFTLDATYISVDQTFIREEINGTTYDYKVRTEPFGNYLDLTDKISTSSGIPTSVYYDEQLSAITGYLYPPPESSMVVHVLATRTIEDFDASTDNPDYPVRWFETLALGLAVRIAPKYGIWGEKLGQLTAIYEKALSKAKADDKEHVSLFVSPTYPTS